MTNNIIKPKITDEKLSTPKRLFIISIILMFIAVVVVAFMSSAANAQDYTQRVVKDPYGATVVAPKHRNENSLKRRNKSPYGATVVAPEVRNENSIKVNKKKHKIKKDKKHMTNPTGQVTDEEFDKLLRGSGRSRR